MMNTIIDDLTVRKYRHDVSKLSDDEYPGFVALNKTLRETSFMDENYRASLTKEVIGIHYKNNDHHPEHFPNGIMDMNLIQISEMICDWVAVGLGKGLTFDELEGTVGQAIRRQAIDVQLSIIMMNTFNFLKERYK